jgi:DNA gyrase subunit B
MQELITRGHIYIAQPPLYRIKKGKSEKYIKDEKEFTREIMRRATENLVIETTANGTPSARLEAGELRAFLMSLDEFDQMSFKLERRLRDSRVVDVLGRIEFAVDSKADFSNRASLEPLLAALLAAQVETAQIRADEEHAAWMVVYHDSTNAERFINIELAAQPEYKRFRVLARQISRNNHAPFHIVKNERREVQNSWQGLLAHVKEEGKRDCSVQRYKGLGEMNAEQLGETTMNPEKRVLLKVRLEDVVESDLIFTTLMGEDVESRRKFIEDNALDVKNLDV